MLRSARSARLEASDGELGAYTGLRYIRAERWAMIITTARLTLRDWREEDRNPFAAMNADPEVMADLGRTLNRAESDAKFDHYVAAFHERGYSRWLVQDRARQFAQELHGVWLFCTLNRHAA